MIRASSLIYAIVIALVLAILSSSVILFQYFKVIESENDLLDSQLRLNVISAINYVLVTNDYTVPSDNRIRLYGVANDSVYIHIEKWGILDLLTTIASSGGHSFSKTALTGELFDKKNNPALYLADNNSPLALCGKTVIKGNCSLPKSGVKRAYIEGQNFIGNQLIDGTTTVSSSALPPIDKNFLDFVDKITNYIPSESDSIISFPSVTNAFCPFADQNHVIFSSEALRLSSCHYEGKIIIVSKKEIEITNNSALKDVIICAPKIVVDDDFTGSLQAYASDSIYIGKNVKLNYPSSISTISDNRTKHPSIIIDEGSSLAGTIIMNDGFDPINKSINLSLEKNTLVTGTVYCNGIVNMKGSIIGSIYCDLFMLKTPSAVYENNMLNSTIDISKVPDGFSMKNFLNAKSQRRIIKWE